MSTSAVYRKQLKEEARPINQVTPIIYIAFFNLLTHGVSLLSLIFIIHDSDMRLYVNQL